MIRNGCPCCGSTLSKTPKRCLERAWFRCRTCYHWVLDLPADLNKKYQRAYHEHKPQPDSAPVEAARLELIMPYISEEASLLDVGCGNGKFLQAMGTIEKRTGMDIDETVRANWEMSNMELLSMDFVEEPVKRTWEIVTAWHVLEHIRDLRKAMDRIVALTAPGGLLVLEVPVERHISIRHYNGHVHNFSPESVAQLLYSYRRSFRCLAAGLGLLWPAVFVVARRCPDPKDRLAWLRAQCLKGGKQQTKGRTRAPGMLE